METVNVLWTGGLDSSYRVIELSKLAVIIQPYYIFDHARRSIKNELRAIEAITDDIKKNSSTLADLMPVKIIYDHEIKADSEISAAWRILNKKYALGSQYDYLARFAKQSGLKLEVGLECSERSKAYNAIKKETQLQLIELSIEGGNYTAYEIIKKNSSNEGVLMFENLLFPATLWHMTKLDEVVAYKNLGFKNSLTKTWFCHAPILGLPCGHCNPCKDCLNEGMAFRVPRFGYFLGAIRNNFIEVVRKIKY